MKIKTLIVFSIIYSAMLCVVLVPQVAHAKCKKDLCDDIEDIDKQRKCYLELVSDCSDKVAELQGQEKTLSNEINYLDSQIDLTQLRIQSSLAKIRETENKIEKLVGDIDELAVRIEKLEYSIDHQRNVLFNRIRTRYKSGNDSPLVVLLGANTLQTLVRKAEYLKTMEEQDNKLIDDMSRTKQSFNLQKQMFETKKGEEETLKQELVQEKVNLDYYKADLENKKIEKNRLLEITQNDEAKYQKLLSEAQRELNQILNAVSVLRLQDGEKVEKGDIIGIQGNTGYSFGDHLHFGVYKYGSFEDITGWNWYYSNYVDPAKKLKKKTVYWNTGCESAGNRTVGSGDWKWPIDSPTVSQGFGNTCWSNVYYGGKVHPAYDMYGPYGAAVYAVEDGEAYFCRNCLGDGGNGVFIFHDNKYMTVYWHLR